MEAKESKFNITETIRSICKARKELQEATARECQLTRPILTDFKMLPAIYQMFCELTGKHGALSVQDRNVFIFIVQYLYAPRNLFGGKMPGGLRRELAKVVGLNAWSPISRGASETLHHYQVYSGFRDEVNRIFAEIAERLRNDGKI